jgi:hypothetical protein
MITSQYKLILLYLIPPSESIAIEFNASKTNTSPIREIMHYENLITLLFEGPKRRTREGGSEWESIKVLLEGDRDSNKMNTTSDTRL